MPQHKYVDNKLAFKPKTEAVSELMFSKVDSQEVQQGRGTRENCHINSRKLI